MTFRLPRDLLSKNSRCSKINPAICLFLRLILHIYTDELLSLLAKNIELSSDIIRHHHNIFISLNVVLYLIMGSSAFTVKKATCKHALSSTILFILHITTREMLEISLKFQSFFKEFAFLSTHHLHHISVQQRQARLSASYRKQPYPAPLLWTILPKKALEFSNFVAFQNIFVRLLLHTK